MIGATHLGIEHLLRQLRDGECTVLLASPGCEGSEARHEEVEPGEGDHVDGELPQIGVQLAGEAQASGDAGHGERDQMVEVAVRRSGELEGAETDVVEGLVVYAAMEESKLGEETCKCWDPFYRLVPEGLVGVLDQLMHGERGVVGLDDRVGHLGRRHHGVGVHDAVGILLPDLGDEQSA